MKNKHKILFIFWKLYLYIQGIKKGKFQFFYSSKNKKYIKSVITGLYGVSITDKKYSFDIGIQFFEPTEGIDARFYSSGFYSFKQYQKEFINKRKFLKQYKIVEGMNNTEKIELNQDFDKKILNFTTYS